MPRHLLARALGRLSFAVACLALATVSHADEIKPAADAPQPLPTAESQAKFQVDPGFRVELVAAEPHLADPVTMAFDADGRIYVAELHGYNLDGYFDVQELNKTGVLDKAVRRIQAPDWAKKKAEKYTYGSVKLLVDEDGDGRVDRGTVFADHLPPCYGVVPARDGVIVLCAPHIYYLADTTGDGVADVRELLFTGFNEGELWSRTNHLVWGLDNWIYACAGRGGPITITGPRLDEPVQLGNVCYRFRADGTALEPATGTAGGYGLGMSDWGDRYLIHNSTNGLQVLPIAYRYQTRNPHVAAPGSQHRSATYSNVFPISQPHPWRVERGSQEAWREFYGHSEANPNGSFTAACSPTIYRGGAFPDAYAGNLFACESQQNLVNRSVPRRDGTRIHLHRPDDFDDREFLASTDGWFRPVDLQNGPDGALYVVDMYREIIEDYSAIPRYLQQQYGLEKGGEHGRIWRVVYEDAPAAKPMRLSGASDDELVAALSHPNVIWRQTAQRLLIERDAGHVAAALESIATGGPSPQARLHALYTLAGIARLRAETVAAALDDPHFAVRWHALQLAEPFFEQSDSLVERVLRMTDDGDATVRLQLALTLGAVADARAAEALAELALGGGDDDWLAYAIMNSSATHADRLFAALLQRADEDGAAAMLGSLADMIGVRGESGELQRTLAALATLSSPVASEVQQRGLAGLLQGLSNRSIDAIETAPLRSSLETLLTNPNADVSLLAFKLAGALRIEDLDAVNELFAAASRRALDEDLALDRRQQALELLAHAPYETVAPVAGALLDARQPLELQAAAVATLQRLSHDGVADLLLQRWAGYSPRIRDAVLEALLARSNRLPPLLDALERGDVEPASIVALRRVQLLEHPDETIRARAAQLLAAPTDDAAYNKLLARYQAALDAPRDHERGRAVFAQHCAACHRVESVGHNIGPPLATAINRPDEALLGEILDPSARITDGFQTYTVVTVDGRVLSGLLAAESATSITLRRDKGAEDLVLRKDIDQIVAVSKSLMPENLHEAVSPQDLADLLTYLRGVFGPPAVNAVVLFDDEAEMVDLLHYGRGSASLETDDVHSGEAALRIAALQRYSDRIPGWEFPIVEHPGPGSFRYLRFAWKSIDGVGAGIELADRGEWGPAESAKRRYVSGENTSPWQAQQISAEPPSNWTVVTIDLWRDNGEFILTGIAPTAMSGHALFDRIELLRSLDEVGR